LHGVTQKDYEEDHGQLHRRIHVKEHCERDNAQLPKHNKQNPVVVLWLEFEVQGGIFGAEIEVRLVRFFLRSRAQASEVFCEKK
jgi:hypothetical protein